jgi:signal transduction histidine kinase
MLDPHLLHPAIAGVLTLLMGVFPYFKRRSRLTRLFALANVCLAAWVVSEIFALPFHSLSMKLLVDRLDFINGILIVLLFFRFLMEFAGIPFEQYRRVWMAQRLLGAVLIVSSPTPFLIRAITPQGLFFDEIPGIGFPVFMAFLLGSLGIASYHLLKRYPHTTGLQRLQLRYVIAGTFFPMLEAAVYFLSLYWPQIPFFYNYLQVAYVATVAYAILSHELMDISVVIRRTLIYSLTSAALTAVSLFIMSSLMRFTSTLAHQLAISSALLAVTITLLFHPLIRGAQQIIDRLFYRRRFDREARLLAVSETMTGRQNLADTITTLCQVVEEDFHPRSWVLYLRPVSEALFIAERQSGEFPPTAPLENSWSQRFQGAAFPILVDATEPKPEREPAVRAAIPLIAHGDLLGYLLLGAKQSDEAYGEQDLALLRILVEHAAVVYEQPKLLREVTGGFVHEIKIPLSNIVLPAELSLLELQDMDPGMKNWPEFGAKLKKRLQFIIGQAMLAARRVEAIQQLSEAEASQRRPVDLLELINQSLVGLEKEIEKSRTQIELRVPSGLAPITGDAPQLEIVFVNLIKNGLESMAASAQGARQLTISAERQGDRMCLRVSDTGAGIPEKERDRVFIPHVTGKGGPHRGLGLYLAKRIIESHYGVLRLEASEGTGAAFTVILPLAPPISGVPI